MKGFFQVSDTRGGGDYIVGKVIGLECTALILGANKGNVMLDRKHLSFLVQVMDRGHQNGAGVYE